MEIKSNEVKFFYDQFTRSIATAYLKFFDERNEEFIKHLIIVQGKFENLKSTLDNTGSIAEKIIIQQKFKRDFLHYLKENYENLCAIDFRNRYTIFLDVATKEIEELSRLVTVKEVFDGYLLSINDNPIVSFRKIFANFWRFVKLGFKRFLNPFRRLFRRKPLEIKVYRERKILLRNIANHYVKSVFVQQSAELLSKLYESQCKALIDIWTFDEKLDSIFQKDLQNTDLKEEEKSSNQISLDQEIESVFNQAVLLQQKTLEEIKNQVSVNVISAISSFDKSYQKVDTLDLPASYFSRKNYLKKQKQVNLLYESKIRSWTNTHSTLIDDWSMDLEFTILYYSVFKEFNLLRDKIDNIIENDLSINLGQIRTFISESQKSIEKAKGDKGLVGTLNAERKRIANELIDKTLSKAIEKLTVCFTDDFEVFSNSILKLIEEISTQRTFLRHKEYLKPSDKEQIKYLSPKELVNFEALPVFLQNISNVKEFTSSKLVKARANLMGLGTVCDFSLESAVLMIQQQDENSINAVEVAIDGYKRAINHLEKVESTLSIIRNNISDELSQAVNGFNDDIEKLKDTENAIALNLKIARIKAVERTNRYKNVLKLFIKNFIPKSLKGLKRAKEIVSEKYREIKSTFGFAPPKKYVSFELTEFIGQTQQALKKLPFVYQRLYQLSPTDEERFFVNREKELEQLTKSFDNWKKDRFITVAIIGEKGSGVTSLINVFLRRTEIKMPIVKFNLDRKIHTIEQYFNVFESIFGQKFENNDQIISYLNSKEEGLTVVFENLHHMYLKRVHGFECMNLFFDLMANTMKKVLWIGAYTTHSWDFLNKTIQIANYFTNEIFVNPLDQKTIENIIYKRNSLSGFQLVFQPDEIDLANKNFVKLNDEDKQNFLQKQFFANLHHLSHGNISLAQLYWLRSTQEVSDEYISIAQINEIDFSFISALTSDELFALQAMVLHDGLTLEDFSIVFDRNINSCRNLLIPMFEKGLLIKPKSKYNVNPIIFEAVVKYLSQRNFIN